MEVYYYHTEKKKKKRRGGEIKVRTSDFSDLKNCGKLASLEVERTYFYTKHHE